MSKQICIRKRYVYAGVIVAFLFLILSGWLVANRFGDKISEESDLNIANSKKLKLGMSIDSVLSIMGHGGVQVPRNNDSARLELMYFHINNGDGGSIRIYLDSALRVNRIKYP